MPGERASVPRIVSTVFPQLPGDSMWAFRLALALGVGVVGVLAAVGLFPVAVVAAAILVPLITVIYLYDVDIYENQPLRVVAFTMLWGATAGGAVAVLLEVIAPMDGASVVGGSASEWLVRSVGVPLLTLIGALSGPLILLPYRKFNDVLDGSTFGAASGVAFGATLVLAEASSFFAGGIRPEGSFVPWAMELLEIAILSPLLTAAVIGAAAGAFWLRYRAPVRDREELGRLGRPAVATAGASVVLVLAGIAETVLTEWLALLALATLALAALIWLRQLIHVGLMQEAEEVEVGRSGDCVNCGRPTPQREFCTWCGISLRALPKGRSAPPRRESPSGAEL